MPPRSLAEARALEFHPVLADGVLLNDKELYLNATGPRGGAGFHVLTPLREPEGRIVFVNRGFVPTDLRAPGSRAAAQLAGTVHIRGLLRLPPVEKPSWFIPDNRPDLNYWFWIDLPAMAAADHLDPANFAPFYLVCRLLLEKKRRRRPTSNRGAYNHVPDTLPSTSLTPSASTVRACSP